MRQLSPAGQQVINDIAQRNGFSIDATLSMLDSVINGNGSQAQFNHLEFSGSGQWMRGGMIMLSDMFNNYLKGRVDGLCNDLSNLVASQPDLVRSGSFQSQSQGSGYNNGQAQTSYGGGGQQQGNGNFGQASLFVPGTTNDWWPTDLRFRTARVRRTACAMPTSPRRRAWPSRSTDASPCTTRWTTRSAASGSNSRTAAA